MPEPRISSVLSGRDRVLIGVFVLVNVAVILGVVLLKGSGEDSKNDTAHRIPRAGRVVVNRAIGARIRKPRGWTVKREDRAIVLRSPDSTAIMSISQPPGGVRSRDVLRSAVTVIQQGYRRVAVQQLRTPSGAICTPSTCKVARLPTVSRVASATNSKGVSLNILVSAPQGRGRAWLVQVFSGRGARAKRLPEAQVALGTLRLRG